jgi:hypothetical protein
MCSEKTKKSALHNRIKRIVKNLLKTQWELA